MFMNYVYAIAYLTFFVFPVFTVSIWLWSGLVYYTLTRNEHVSAKEIFFGWVHPIKTVMPASAIMTYLGGAVCFLVVGVA